MEQKFRIIEILYYDNKDYNEHKSYRVQEWKKSILGYWRWKYFKEVDGWDGGSYPRRFASIEDAREILDKYIKQKPHIIVVEELVY